MICHFRFRAPARPRCHRSGVKGLGPPGQVSPAGEELAADPQALSDPLLSLLSSLRGRQITLQVGERLVTGKLVTTDPLILVGPAGEATMVVPGVVKSVQF